MQDQGSGPQPIGYASRLNDKHQVEYPVTHLECLAVAWAVQHFRPYLYGRRFTNITDHNALKWLMTKRDLTCKLHRWALALQEYEFEIEYRPGRENVVPDALSRAPVLAVGGGAEDGGASIEDAMETADGRAGQRAQIDEAAIRRHQQASDQCVRAFASGRVQKLKVEERDGIVYVETDEGWRVLLPPVLRPLVLRECHESVWAGHLMGPQTLARVKASYWWPHMRMQVLDWVGGCRECGSRKVCPSRVIPPLRSLRVGALGDRWALDFAGPLPVTARDNRFVVAVIEYLSKWVILIPVPTRMAEPVARLLMERVVFQHGPFRELLMDGVKELQSEIVVALVVALQAKQPTSVPYRPNTIGLVERFNHTWKDMVSMYVGRHQADWDEWIAAAAYAHNSSVNTVTGFSPYQLTDRDAKLPGDLLLGSRREDVGDIGGWHRRTRAALDESWALAQQAIEREQQHQAAWYSRKVRSGYEFKKGQLVWVFKPPRGEGVTKLRHPWLGPCRVQNDAGHDNFVVSPLDGGDDLLAHESMLLPYYESTAVRASVAAEIQYEDRGIDESPPAPPANVFAARAEGECEIEEARTLLRLTPRGVYFKELARRRARNPVGRYEQQIRFKILSGPMAGRCQWMGLEEYELLWTQGFDADDFAGDVEGDVEAGSGE